MRDWGANFLLIATGQNALSGTALLQKLTGRFPVTVELQDTDVEQVTREVVLKKKPTAEAGIKKLLDDHSGEIERQLSKQLRSLSPVGDRGLASSRLPHSSSTTPILGTRSAGSGQNRELRSRPQPTVGRL